MTNTEKDFQKSSLFAFLQNHDIPRRYLKQTDKKQYSVPFEKVRELIDSDKGLFVYGSVGTGKTQMIIDVLVDLAEKNKVQIVVGTDIVKDKDGNSVVRDKTIENYNSKLFKYYSAPRLLAHIRSTFNSDESMEDFLNILRGYEYLVIDDLGTEKVSEWVLETLYLIISDRYDNMQKIIITSNKDLSEIAHSLGDRISSRIAEMCKVIELKGEDKRLT